MLKHRIYGIWFLFALSFALFEAHAGGRYQNPPENLDKVVSLASKAKDSLNQGQTEAALTSVQEALALAKESNEIKTTAPMQRATSHLRMIASKLKRGETAQAADQLQQIIQYLDEVAKSYQ